MLTNKTLVKIGFRKHWHCKGVWMAITAKNIQILIYRGYIAEIDPVDFCSFRNDKIFKIMIQAYAKWNLEHMKLKEAVHRLNWLIEKNGGIEKYSIGDPRSIDSWSNWHRNKFTWPI
jgi:hypothetical protein